MHFWHIVFHLQVHTLVILLIKNIAHEKEVTPPFIKILLGIVELKLLVSNTYLNFSNFLI